MVSKRTGPYGIPVASDGDGEKQTEREREREKREREWHWVHPNLLATLNFSTLFSSFSKLPVLLLQPLQVNDSHFVGDKL